MIKRTASGERGELGEALGTAGRAMDNRWTETPMSDQLDRGPCDESPVALWSQECLLQLTMWRRWSISQ